MPWIRFQPSTCLDEPGEGDRSYVHSGRLAHLRICRGRQPRQQGVPVRSRMGVAHVTPRAAHVHPRDTLLPRLLRALTIALLIVTCSGLSSLVAAASCAHDSECADCGTGCPASCDPHSCPPGPLCPCTSHTMVTQAPRIPTLAPIMAGRPIFMVDTRIPASVTPDDVFHPPRRLA